ncbi:MAG: TrkH family potassium uptake protein [Deltaproteobacteria bacterium]|nr:TrkH family potassium uptake protein [Deltaproteobacteria bacterium]
MREKEFLMTRYSGIISSIGMILFLSSFVMVTPILILFSFPEEANHAWDFIIPSIYLSLIGITMWKWFHPPYSITLTVQEGGVVVIFSWIIVILFSAWPFTSVLGIPYSRALFESVSGWTTTGLSVVDVSSACKMILIWRSIIQLAGGAGLAIIMMSAIIGPTGVGISSAEGRSDQLVPNVRRSARIVLIIYLLYAITGIIAYHISGMSLFDAFNHSFTAVSTGGFSTRYDSIGYWDSATIEAVSVILMILGNLSFVTAWYLWRGEFRVVSRNGEVRLMGVLIPLSVALLYILTSSALFPGIEKPIRVAVFEAVSAITTTGFSTVTYNNWNALGIFLLVILMMIGGGTCSTAGGIKQFRIYFLLKMLYWEIKSYLLPTTAVFARPVWEGNRQVFVDDAKVRQVMTFISLYMATYVLGVMVLCSCGYSLSDSLFEFASAIGTVGISIGVTSPQMADIALWSETIAMFLGRMELIIVFTSIIKIADDSRKMLGKKDSVWNLY